MNYAMRKSTYTKLEPKVLQYKRQYKKNFSEESFLKDLKSGLSKDGIVSYFNKECEVCVRYVLAT